MANPIATLADLPGGRCYLILEATTTPGQFRLTTFGDNGEYLEALERLVEQRGASAVKGLTVAATVEI